MHIRICSKCKAVIPLDDNYKPIKVCKCNAESWDCDEDIYPLLRTLWNKGYETLFSCSGHAVFPQYAPNNSLRGVRKNKIEHDVYIMIKGPVKVQDLEKYKYGNAYIKIRDVNKRYIDEMVNYYDIELPENYKLNVDDEYFKEYLSYFDENNQESIKKQLTERECLIDYRISILYEDLQRKSYIDKYRKLLEYRNDVAKLVDMLPVNK